MELAMCWIPVLRNIAFGQPTHFLEGVPQFRDVRLGAGANGDANTESLKHDPRAICRVEIGGIDSAHAGPLVGRRVDEAFLLEQPERLPHRRSTHAELTGHL